MTKTISYLEEKIFPALRKKQVEMAVVPPQTLGSLTPYYHRVIPSFKIAPWRLIFLMTIFSTLFLRLVLGPWFVRLASLLQWGF